MGQALAALRKSDASANSPGDGQVSSPSATNGDDGWQIAESRATKKQKKSQGSGNYPEIKHAASARIQSHLKISDLQSLVLYILADAAAPQWVAVRHRQSIKKVVVLMVPGLEKDMFRGVGPFADDIPNGANENAPPNTDDESWQTVQRRRDKILYNSDAKPAASPDDYYPIELEGADVAAPVKGLTSIFPHAWPIKAPGDDKFPRMYSPLQAMLIAPLPKSREEKKGRGPPAAREAKDWKNTPTPITSFLAASDELQESEYVLHPAYYTAGHLREDAMTKRRGRRQAPEDGWVDTKVANLDEGDVPIKEYEQGSLTAGRNILCMDCEMCKTSDEKFELTRISLVKWDGSVAMDELVKPDRPITDYLTR